MKFDSILSPFEMPQKAFYLGKIPVKLIEKSSP